MWIEDKIDRHVLLALLTCSYVYIVIYRYIQADVHEIHALTIHTHTYRYTWDTYIDNTYSYIGLLIFFCYIYKDWHANSPHGSPSQVYWDSKMKASPTSLSRVPIFPRSAATWLQQCDELTLGKPLNNEHPWTQKCIICVFLSIRIYTWTPSNIYLQHGLNEGR